MQHRAAVTDLVDELLPIVQGYLSAQAVTGEGTSGSSSSGGLLLHQQHSAGASPAPKGSQGPRGEQRPAAADPGAVTQRLIEYSLSIPTAVPSREMALAEFAFRNGWFLQQARTPRHEAWLQRAGVAVPAPPLQLG